MHGATKVMCSMCEEKGIREKEDRPMSESPGISRVATPKCKMGTASHLEETRGPHTTADRYPEHGYAMPVPLNAVRQNAVCKDSTEIGATVGNQNDTSQYVYKQGETSADEATIWQQKAYDDHLVQAARHQLWKGRTTRKVVMNRDDTSVSSGSRIEEIGSAFRLHEPKGKAKEKRDKTESVSSFMPSAFSLSPHIEVEMK